MAAAAERICPAQVVSDGAVVAAGGRWRRVVVRTPWLTAADDLGGVLGAALAAFPARPGDVVAIAEKIAVVTSNRVVDAAATPLVLLRPL